MVSQFAIKKDLHHLIRNCGIIHLIQQNTFSFPRLAIVWQCVRTQNSLLKTVWVSRSSYNRKWIKKALPLEDFHILLLMSSQGGITKYGRVREVAQFTIKSLDFLLFLITRKPWIPKSQLQRQKQWNTHFDFVVCLFAMEQTIHKLYQQALIPVEIHVMI